MGKIDRATCSGTLPYSSPQKGHDSLPYPPKSHPTFPPTYLHAPSYSHVLMLSPFRGAACCCFSLAATISGLRYGFVRQGGDCTLLLMLSIFARPGLDLYTWLPPSPLHHPPSFAPCPWALRMGFHGTSGPFLWRNAPPDRACCCFMRGCMSTGRRNRLCLSGAGGGRPCCGPGLIRRLYSTPVAYICAWEDICACGGIFASGSLPCEAEG